MTLGRLMTLGRPGRVLPVLLTLLGACDADLTAPPADRTLLRAGADRPTEPHNYEFIVPAGELLFLNLPGNPGGGGFTGPLFDPFSGREVGTFTTDILLSEGTDIFTVLAGLALGPQHVSGVRGTFATLHGTITDQHFADVVIIGPGVTPGYEVTIRATGSGTVTGATQKYNRDGGSSDLELVAELDFDGLLPAKAVHGTFVFVLD